MKKRVFIVATIALSALCMASCVTKEKYNEAQDLASRYYDDARDCNSKLEAANVKINELTDEINRLKAQQDKLAADTVKLSHELKRVQDDCAVMQQQNMDLLDKLKTSKSKEEAQAMLAEIQALQNQLVQREDALFKAERDLNDKLAELAEKEAKIAELNAMIQENERKMQEIKDNIKKALEGYEGNGIQVTTKNGRIYVSLDEQLLFQSGKWNVNAKGEAALTKLADVLAGQNDLNILVEGHTDNIPYNGSGNVLDNWDLSVKRATAVVRILLKNGNVEPSTITAAGRSQFCPTDTANTAEARQKNRRTEIILSPNLDQVLKLID